MFKKSLLALCVLSTTSAYSLVNVEAFYGKRWYTKTLSHGNEISVGVNLDPIPLVPVSIGANYTVIDLDKKGLELPTAAEIRQFGLDVKVWAPFFPVLTPYARGRYIANSKLKISYDDGRAATDTNFKGYSVGAGIDYKIVPMIHAQLEFRKTWETAESVENSKQTLNSHSLLIGLLVGI